MMQLRKSCRRMPLCKGSGRFDQGEVRSGQHPHHGPITGLIERSRYYEGRLVSAQTDLLTTIHRVDPMYVVVNVPRRLS